MRKRSSFTAVCSFKEFLDEKDDFLLLYRYVLQSLSLKSCRAKPKQKQKWPEVKSPPPLLLIQPKFKIETAIPDTSAQPLSFVSFLTTPFTSLLNLKSQNTKQSVTALKIAVLVAHQFKHIFLEETDRSRLLRMRALAISRTVF